MNTEEKADAVVSYHAPDEIAIERINKIREATKNLIVAIAENCPAGPDRTAAIRKTREAMMTANASIVVPRFPF